MAEEEIKPLRTRVLSNSAAEFVETRAGKAIVAETMGRENTEGTDEPEFARALDKFVPPGGGPNESEYYQLSTEKVSEFRSTLTRFVKTLKSRKIDQQLSIELKDPEKYTLDDVFAIATKLLSNKESSESTQSCMRVIRKGFSLTAKHKPTMNNLLKFVPNDSYGVVIFGGFTLILAAIEHHEKLRLDVQEALADIHRKLENIHRVTEVYRASPRLQAFADLVFISIFCLLEKIIDRLSMGFGEKLKSKAKGHGDDIAEAKDALDISIVQFQEEVEICAQQRFGRIEETLQELVRKMGTIEEQHHSAFKVIPTTLYDSIYRFLASNPGFNPIDGTVNPDKLIEYTEALAVQDRLDLIDKWIEDVPLKDFTADTSDVSSTIKDMDTLGLKDQDKLQWILISKELNQWLSRDKSCCVELKPETSPEVTMNSITCTTALLAELLSAIREFAVLPFFWMARPSRFRRDMISAMVMLNTFNAQLLTYIQEQNIETDLSILTNDRNFRKSQQRRKKGLALFDHLLSCLPDECTVFILVDMFFMHSRGSFGCREDVAWDYQYASNLSETGIENSCDESSTHKFTQSGFRSVAVCAGSCGRREKWH